MDRRTKTIKEFKELNKQARSILNKMQRTSDPIILEELRKEFDEVNAKLTIIQKSAIAILEDDKPITKDKVTQKQAQEIWDAIRNKIRLAKFNDSGIELPAIDMAKLFRGRKSATWQDINSQVQDIINGWEPVTY